MWKTHRSSSCSLLVSVSQPSFSAPRDGAAALLMPALIEGLRSTGQHREDAWLAEAPECPAMNRDNSCVLRAARLIDADLIVRRQSTSANKKDEAQLSRECSLLLSSWGCAR